MELPIFLDDLRSSGNWTAALERSRQAWAAAGPEAMTRARLLRLAHSLARAGRAVEVESLARLVIAGAPEEGDGSLSDAEREAARLLRASDLISAWGGGRASSFDLARLFELYRTLTGSSEANPVRLLAAESIASAHNPAPPPMLPALLDNAFDWFTAPSFDEIHPVEQATLVYLRLLDLQPFSAANERVSLLAASYYVERAGLPPLVIFADEASVSRYAAALEAAFRMLTQPLVEFFAASIARVAQEAAT
jgi:Fic family protein